jgi:hypothetical protein
MSPMRQTAHRPPTRLTGLGAVLGLTLLLGALAPALARARAFTASAGGTTATITYALTRGTPSGATGLRLVISRGGRRVYGQPVPTTGCLGHCTPVGAQPVRVASLYGHDGEDVVLTLWDGGADCCTIADVYVPSAAMHSYVMDQHNFGAAGFVVRDIGPGGTPRFVSADPGFYCRFTACVASALPVQIIQFSAERFVIVTRQFPALVRADATHWLSLYRRDPRQALGAIGAWAADEDNLGQAAMVSAFLRRQQAAHKLTVNFVRQLESFLKAGHYTS